MKPAPGWLLFLGFAVSLLESGAVATTPASRLENEALRIDLSPQDHSIAVLDKRIDLTW